MAKILVVDDEKSIRDLIKMTLSIENYEAEEAEDGEMAFRMLEKSSYDLVLLDIMLPKIDGYQVLQKLKDKNIPVIFLTAKITLQDKIFGLRMGADDYITKPFEPMELLARIETILRRSQKYAVPDVEEPKDKNVLRFEDITMYLQERSVKKGNQEIILTVKEFDLLKTFIENKNIVLSREILLDKIWGYDYFGGTRTIDMHVKQIREKLDLKESLETIYKVGYKLKG
ncbi:MAG: response regulator transcription factor [bacterium]|nr:response regulator transcription factor [bacterium]